MIKLIFRKVFGTKNDRELKSLRPRVRQINELESAVSKLRDDELRGKTIAFRERIDQGESLDSILPEAFAVVREASRRALQMRHFDVQLIGGMVLHQGKISEMKTGEGKTLVATLPAYLNALASKGVHVVTVNDYLARRDAEWMGRLYSFLGLSTGVIVAGMDQSERYAAYRSDITYGQNNEFGFDYLRDNMKLEFAEKVQRGHHFAIVDEVDSILVDEARTPLIISGPSEEATEKYQTANGLIKHLRDTEHYTVDLKTKQVMLTDDGVTKVEQLLNIENLYDPKHMDVVHHVTQALKAHVTMRLDVDYVVRDGQVIIVDEFTGRLMTGRRWSDGLHQAVEAKEGVKIARENQTLATITFQNYFRMYSKLSGMTGTADTEAVEFRKIYNLDVIVVPTNKPMVRADYPDVVFASERGKYNAVCDEIVECVERGQPVLAGTASIEKSELLSSLLGKRKIKHHVLNAKQHEREAEIVAQAGRFRAVTISTNMAGRGTDIILGGNPEFLAASAAGTKDSANPTFQEELAKFRELCAAERVQVIEAGGLHILGTERHESRRIDNQLRGRSGRQGDPGSSRFYVSLEDDLMKRFGGERMQALMARVGLKEDDAIEGKLVASAIERAQKRVEGYHFDIRKHLLDYDNVMNKQREVIYTLREKILRGEEIEEQILEMIPDVIEDIVTLRASEKERVATWDVAGMFGEFRHCFGLEVSPQPFLERLEHAGKELAQEIFDELRLQALKRYEERKYRFGGERMVKLERIIFLQAIDHFWKEHLTNIDHLREGIQLRAWAQLNPLLEYQREAFALFRSMMLAIKVSVLQNLFIPELPNEQEISELEQREHELQRKREELAKTIHEDVLDAPSNKVTNGPADGGSQLNREQRRRQEAIQRLARDVAQESRPGELPGMAVARASKKKKRKEERRARRKNR